MKTYLIAFLDLLLCMLMVVLLMVKPVTDDKAMQPPGALSVYTVWMDNGNKNDVDTWFIGPAMNKPIGYDNKDSTTCNLVRDDLGSAGSHDGNFENIFCRETLDGEYAIDVFAYEITDVPIEVTVQVVMIINGSSKVLFTEKVILTSKKDEKTVIRFKLKDGEVVPGSVNHVYISLFDYRK